MVSLECCFINSDLLCYFYLRFSQFEDKICVSILFHFEVQVDDPDAGQFEDVSLSRGFCMYSAEPRPVHYLILLQLHYFYIMERVELSGYFAAIPIGQFNIHYFYCCYALWYKDSNLSPLRKE